MKRAILDIDDRLIDFGEHVILPKMLFTRLIAARYPKDNGYTFRWFSGLVPGIQNVPGPVDAGLDIPDQIRIIEKDEITERKLLTCFAGTLVYKALYKGEREVIVKYACDKPKVLPLVQEFAAGFMLIPKHKYLASYIGVTDRSGLVSEYFSGKSLDSVETIDERVKSQCWEGLRALHSEGISHGDIKPQNILVDKDTVKIIDFSTAYKPGWFLTPQIYGTSGYILDSKVAIPTIDNDVYAMNKCLGIIKKSWIDILLFR